MEIWVREYFKVHQDSGTLILVTLRTRQQIYLESILDPWMNTTIPRNRWHRRAFISNGPVLRFAYLPEKRARTRLKSESTRDRNVRAVKEKSVRVDRQWFGSFDA